VLARTVIRSLATLFLISGLLAATQAHAHGFGARYDLPIPLSFYLFGTATTVAVSFVMAALFIHPAGLRETYPALRLLNSNKSERFISAFAAVLRAVAVAYFILMLAAGLFGEQTPLRNIIVVSVWIVGWVAISLSSALIADVWRILNAWDAIFAFAERLYARLGLHGSLTLGLRYPAALDVWPAVLLFMLFAWMELIWSGRDVPARLAQAILLYSGITWLGMLLFGRETWRQRGEVFAIVFGIFARFAPLTTARDGSGVALRLPAVGLLEERHVSVAQMMLVIAVLATVTFDGLLETPLWAYVDTAIIDAPDDSILWKVFSFSEAGALRFGRSIGLLLFVALFSAVYFLTCKAMAAIAASRDTMSLARRFVFTLLPISIAYHIAHYFSYLFNGGQLVIPLLSDPFGFGWDLLGTAGYRPDIGFVGPVLQWYVAVAAIVVGHIIAVFLAHVMALSTFGQRGAALLSQIPFVALMVGYTMLSLWILSQPIVETSLGQ
jgi:hypothetical protein